MTYREAFTNLIQILGQLYSDQASIRRIIIQVNLPIEQILFSGRADNMWADVLYKARRHNQVEDIFAVVLGEYPAVSELHTAVAGYRDVVARGDVPPPSLRRCDFYAHVSLPPNFVARPALLNDVRDVLLATPTTALTSAIPMDALHGMGGIGKSVVARALCDDAEVQDVFSDGILWATVGQTPDLIARLREWVEALGGIIPQTAPTINQLKQNLAELLSDRACLLILDDVWHRADAEPFLVGGPRCRLLLTTRDSEVARGLGAGVHAVPAMDPDEAVDLLERWAGGAIRQADESLKRQIVRRLGYLPLAIKLAGSQLQRKSPERWLAGFDATQLQERRVEKVHDSLARTFALSLNELEATERRLYVALAIFREDEATPILGIGKLWAGLAGYGEEQVVDLVQDLAARALLQVTDEGLAAVVIHDLLRDFMGAELGEAGRQSAHRALLDAYWRTQTSVGWATALDDGYLYEHLVYHLDQLADHEASAATELQSLFANDAWLQVRVSGAGDNYNGYLADLDVVWWRAHQETLRQIEVGEAPAAFAECMRYALIRTSVNSLASNYEPALVVRAVEMGLWSVQRALSVTIRVPDEKALRMLAELAPQLSGDLLAQSLATALTIRHEGYRAQALAALAPRLLGEEKAYALSKGLTAALAIRSKEHRLEMFAALFTIHERLYSAQALAALAPQLSGDLLAQALAAALTIQDVQSRVQALAALAPQLSGDLLAQALAAALTIQDVQSRVQALAALAPQLSGDLLAQALATALAIQDEQGRVEALAALVPQLSGEEKTYALAQGLAAALAIQDEQGRVKALTTLAPQLSGEEKTYALAQGLAAALAIRHEWFCAQALAALAPHLSGEEKAYALAQGLAVALAIQEELLRTQALAALAPQLSGDLLAQALAAALAMQYEQSRAQALAALAPQLSDEEKAHALAQGLAAALTIQEELSRAHALAAFAPQLSGDLLTQALTAALAIRHEGYRAQALAVLAPQLSGDLLAQALAAALTIHDEGYRVQALAAFASQLSGAKKAYVLAQGLVATLSIRYEEYRAEALAALAPQLSGDLLAQGLTAALAIRHEEYRAEALAALAPQLSGDLLAQGLTATIAIQDEKSRVQALAALAPQLSGEEKAYALVQALTAALAISYEEDCAEALTALAPQLSGDLLAQGLTAAIAIQDEEDCAQALAALAPQLWGDLLAQALTAVLAIQDEKSRVQALEALAPQLSGDILAQALAAALAIRHEKYRALALAALAPHLSGEEKAYALAQGLAAAGAILDEKSRALALAALAPQLLGEEKAYALVQALTAALAISYEKDCAQALTALAPQLSGDLLAQALAAALTIQDEKCRALALAALATYRSKVRRPYPYPDSYCWQRCRSVSLTGLKLDQLWNALISKIGLSDRLLVSRCQDKDLVLSEIRIAAIQYIWNYLRYQKREILLSFCSETRLFCSPIFDAITLSRIAGDIVDVCEDWTWL